MSEHRHMWSCLLCLLLTLSVLAKGPGPGGGPGGGAHNSGPGPGGGGPGPGGRPGPGGSGPGPGGSRPGPGSPGYEEEFDYDEVSITFNVKDIGGVEMPAVIHNDTVYLPVSTLFNFLKIRNIPSAGLDSVSGFFIDQQFPYVIDHRHRQIIYQQKTFPLPQQSIVRIADEIYLRTDILGLVFGLNCKFIFRNLAVNMETKVELPVVREMRQELMRQNISKLKGEMQVDTTIGRTYPLFHFGMADWAVIATQRKPGFSDTRLNLNLGGMLAGGEAFVSLNYNNFTQQATKTSISHDSNYIRPLDERQQFYRWRYANNDNTALRQIIAGKLYASSIASIFAPVVGVTLTNTPTSFRRSYGTYTLSNFTDPNWIVELYVNGVLVDYTRADAAGFFSFQVPLVYGNTQVTLRYYGPWGEERFKDENIVVPFNFLPYKEFEYNATAGMVEDSLHSHYAHVQGNYGLTRQITIGAGMEYLSSVRTGKGMPFVNMSMLVARGLLFTADYVYNVRARGIMTYRHRTGLEAEFDYIRYKEGQKAINFNYKEEHKLIVSRPLNFRHFSSFTRVTLDHILLPGNINYTTAEWLVTGSIKKIGTNLSTYGFFLENTQPYIYSNLALTVPLAKGLIFLPQVQYGYSDHRFTYVRGEIGKYIMNRGYVNFTFEQNYKSNITNVGIGFRYDLDFVQTSLSAWRGSGVSTIVEAVRGGMMYDKRTHHFDLNNRINVGTGGVTLVPFLDLNANGKRDKNEPKVADVKVSVRYGNVIYSKSDSTIMITQLEPFVNYYVTVDANSLENIAWRLDNRTYSIAIDPNNLKVVEIPVTVVGEVNGRVFLNNVPQGRVLVLIRNSKGGLVARALTEPDGTFNYIGLAPGNYTASIDQVQLNKLQRKSVPGSIPFTIRVLRDGDVVEKIIFRME